ncbi:MAG: recombinase family protein [Pseudonocardiaceae bacterium]
MLYLRVSSEGQVNTDYNPEGISLPAQRKAAHERAHEIGAPVVTEFIDPGKTAKSIEHRDAFLDMISYLRAHPNVRYVVVYALSRFARNRYDDAIMMATLEKLGVHLVSATERNLDDTPAGRAMHGMLAVFNEYQVLVSGEDIKYKMGQKACSGGTLGIAKLGYQNVRIKYDGREIRTIAVDPERAPYVTMAYELYATGQYSFPELRDALTDAGLRTKGNRRYGPRPISIHTIGNLLRDRYYLGTVTYDGVEYPGRHEALTTPDLFERVQKILYVERDAGTRERVHDHYLKGTVWCARCKRRLILRPSTSKTGNRYFYYICRGVQEHDCDLPSLPVAKVEKAVTDHYTRVTIPAQHRATLETLAADACTDSTETTTKLRTNLRRQLTELDRQEDRYLDLLGDPDWPEQKLKAKMRDVRNNKQRITRQLEETTDTLDPGRAVLTAALHLLDRPRDLYDTATEHARKLLNKAIFTRLYVDTNPTHHPTITTDDLQEPFGSLIHAIRTTHTGQQPPNPQNSTDAQQHDNQTHLGDLLASALTGQSASKAAMVGLTWHNPNTLVLAEGPEISIKPVGIRRVSAGEKQ